MHQMITTKQKITVVIIWCILFCLYSVEYKGHSLLEGARQADLARVKKYLAVDIVNFKHPYNGDSALVSP